MTTHAYERATAAAWLKSLAVPYHTGVV